MALGRIAVHAHRVSIIFLKIFFRFDVSSTTARWFLLQLRIFALN